MGPLWLDIKGCELDAEERDILEHPTVGGVILFARNYFDPDQLNALTRSIRQAAKSPILIGVDQEGGRVQRFKEGLTRLPSAQQYAKHQNGPRLAEQGGWLMAAELMVYGVDLSFAPVLDTGFACQAIGSRAFGEEIETVIQHSRAFLQGMKAAGMATTGKHFPGHGGVIADSHFETPYDPRDDVLETDMRVFQAHMDAELLDAVMPAHVIYPHYDRHPASGSAFWLKQILRERLGFEGIIFSDDLAMEGASVMGDVVSRARQALDAGCHMLLVCNQRSATVKILDQLPVSSVSKAISLQRTSSISATELKRSPVWKAAREAIAPLIDTDF